MSKINTICLTCGKVQIRTDVLDNITGKYVFLKQTRMCPKCERTTKHIATKKVQNLRTKLEEKTVNSSEKHILELIKRY